MNEPPRHSDEQLRPVVVLSNKESEKIVDLLGLKTNTETNFSLVDMLIKELVSLRHPGAQKITDSTARAESVQFGNLRSAEVVKENKPVISRRKSSFNKDTPTEKNKENVEANNYYFGILSPQKKSKNELRNSLRMSRDITNEIIKETYEEANGIDEEYSQDFESMSGSQSLPNIGGNTQSKKVETAPTPKSNNYTSKQLDRMESIEESYADDFDDLSAASGSRDFSAKYGKNFNVKTNNLKDNDDKGN